jgi:cytochrome b561
MFDRLTTLNIKENVIDVVNVVLGVCLALAPWAVAFSENAAASGVHLAVGIAVAVLAAARLWFVHGNPPRVTA